MKRSTHVLAVAAVTSLTLVVAVTTATARRLALSTQGFAAIWPLIDFEASGFLNVECPLTLEGSFHSRTLSKVCGSLIGYVTNAVFREASCIGGHFRALRAPNKKRFRDAVAVDGVYGETFGQ